MRMRVEAVLMTGLSFCLGLIIGLVIHLPTAISPIKSDNSHPETDSYRLVNDVRSRLVLELKPQQNRDYHKYTRIKKPANSGEKDTNKINTPSYERKQKQLYGDNIFSKQRNTANPIEGIEKEIKQIPSKVVLHGEQTPLGGNSVIETTVNKHEIHSNSNKSPEFVTSYDNRNEKHEGTIQDGDSDTNRMQNSKNISRWIKGAYFTQDIDLSVPGFSDFDIQQWRLKAKNEKIVRISEGCGRMQNRKIIFSNGTPACVRYRVNIDQMQGEIYSYYLSLLLGIRNVPPSVVLNVDPHGAQWEGVGEHIVRAEWGPNRPLIVTPWVDNLTPSYIPQEMRKEPRTLHPGVDLLKGRNRADIIELAQWSDLVVFDYLTANVDRIVNNMVNLQWNSDMMENPTHNLGKIRQSSQLVFLDNESGLFHSYRLLDRYSQYHDKLLRGLCVFRKSTAQNIKTLHQNVTSATDLFERLTKFEPLNTAIPRMPVKTLNKLIERISAVYRQILFCEKKYGT